MPEVQEVFQMATQKVRPDPGALERQHQDQRQHAIRRKASVFMLIGALVLIAGGVGISILRSQDDADVGTGGNPLPSASPIPPPEGPLEPGTYAFDTNFDAQYQVSIDVPAGYQGAGFGVLKNGRNETSVSAWVVGDVYEDVCDNTSLVDPATVASAEGVAAALADQKHMQISAPTDVTLDGYRGTYMERTLPPSIRDRCDLGQYNVWSDTAGSGRWLTHVGQHDLLWVLDVDGSTLVIDASIDADSPASDRTEVLEMVDSIRIARV
jgi:hypothetical protein